MTGESNLPVLVFSVEHQLSKLVLEPIVEPKVVFVEEAHYLSTFDIVKPIFCWEVVHNLSNQLRSLFSPGESNNELLMLFILEDHTVNGIFAFSSCHPLDWHKPNGLNELRGLLTVTSIKAFTVRIR